MSEFLDFINQVPDGVMQRTETHLCSNIALFKPLVYMGGVQFVVSDYHIVIPSENTPDALFNNKMIHGEQRKIMAVNPGDTVSCLKNAPAKPYYSFMINANLLHKIAEEMDFSGEIRFENILNPFSSELFQTLKSLERESKRSVRLNLLLDSLEIQIAALLLREFKTNMKSLAPFSQSSDSYTRLAKDYIDTYFSSNITLNDICEKIHVTSFHFIRMFKKEVGMTPHRYLLNVRLERAKELLSTRQYSVAETALMCGFESISHFSDTFKKQTGYTPVDYKRRA